jgi:3-deoxy-D-manno-octulosonic-acid transferase
MAGFYDIAYASGLFLAAPVWLLRTKARRKVLSALRQRMGDVPVRQGDEPAVMIHAVSLGEMNATRALVQKLRAARAGIQFVISTTTNTGFEQARKLYGSAADATVIRYPLDFTGAVARVLDRLRPGAVVLMELEVWPNFLRQCERRGTPVLVVNARLTPSSYRNYRMGGVIVRRMFRRISRVCAQDELYAGRFVSVGVSPQRVSVTGTMKFDTAQVGDRIEGDAELAGAVGLNPGHEKIWVCGSTGPGEEKLILEAYKKIGPNVRLVLVPRHPERFDEVAAMIAGAGFEVARRSGGPCGGPRGSKPVILGDTMGEQRKFYSLADVVFVGRTLVDLGPRQHGSDMIEPAALGKPIVIGPFTQNFADAMKRFRDARAMVEITGGAPELAGAVGELLSRPEHAKAVGERARQVVRENQGATDRHVKLILEALGMADQALAHH